MRAAEYTSVLGAIADMHGLDRRRMEQWAEQISGPVIDAGCGPGHWTDYLHRRGLHISGVDLVPGFIASARIRFPDVPFRVSLLRALDLVDGGLDGVLAWYPLIHLAPAELPPLCLSFVVFSDHKVTCLLAFSMASPAKCSTMQLSRPITGL